VRRLVETIGAELVARNITKDGELQAIVFLVTLGRNERNRREFLSGIAEQAAEMDDPSPTPVDAGRLEGGQEYAVREMGQELFIVAGYSGCHTIAVISSDRGSARSIAAAIAGAPGS
jgi:hypothetical protein